MYIDNVLEYINSKYNPSLIILYGSFQSETYNTASDVDMIIFSQIKSFCHDSSEIQGHTLDAWIYPETEIDNVEKYAHVLPCSIVKDTYQKGKELLENINEYRLKNTEKITFEEYTQLNSWIDKMIKRSEENSVEGNYRYNWLLHDFPELFCKFNNEYYNGPIKTINEMKKNKELFKLYSDLIIKHKNIRKMKKMYLMITRKS